MRKSLVRQRAAKRPQYTVSGVILRASTLRVTPFHCAQQRDQSVVLNLIDSVRF